MISFYENIIFQCVFKNETHKVKKFLKSNGFNLTTKRIKNPTTILVDVKNKEYKYNKSNFLGSFSVYWLFESLLNKELNKKIN